MSWPVNHMLPGGSIISCGEGWTLSFGPPTPHHNFRFVFGLLCFKHFKIALAVHDFNHLFPIFKYNPYTFALHEHGIAAWKSTTSNDWRMRYEFIQRTNIMWTLKAVTRHRMPVGLLAGFFLWLLLMPGAVPGWSGCAFLAHASRASYAPITSLRVLRGLAGWLGFLGTAAFLFALHVFGARKTLFRWTPTGCTFLRCRGRRGQPGTFLNVILHLLARGGYGTKAGPTCKICVVMHADNMVKVGRIILDGVSTERTTRHVWLVPVLGFSRQVNRDTNKRASHMQFLQQTQRSNSPTLENHDDIQPSLCAGK